MRPERNRGIGKRVRHLAVELGVVDLAVRRILERIAAAAEALLLGERLFLVHLGPQHRIGARALGLDSRNELLIVHLSFEVSMTNGTSQNEF